MIYKQILKQLKKEGLPLLEDQVELVVNTTVEVLEKHFEKHDNMILRIVSGLMPAIKKELLEEIDKIDGKEG